MLTEEVNRKTPEETLKDVEPYFEEVGITRVADLTGMDRIGIPVFAVIRPDSTSLAVDSGKGVTKEQAKCSAVMEGIERWAQDAQDLNIIMGHGTKAYRFPMVRGAKFNPDFYHKWVEGMYWHSKDSVMIPYYCVKNYECRLPLYEMCWQSGTNGLAAGNTRIEAILQGAYELVERDAVTIWMSTNGYKGTRRVDDLSVEGDTNRTMLDMCVENGVEPYIYDATSDIGIPTYICMLFDMRADIGVYKGYGCNLDSNIALQRAICEAAQSRAVFLSGARDDMRWIRHVVTKAIPSKQTMDEMDADKAHEYQAKSLAFLSDEQRIEFINDMLAAVGCGKLIVADILEKEHVSVVKVLAESLEGYHNAYLQVGKRAKA